MILRKLKENGGLSFDMTNLGATLKKTRESKGISLNRISEETRISTRFLAAIENEEFHLLPGGIFNRGFVRAYAERVGLDPNQAVAEYDRLMAVQVPAEEPIQPVSNGKPHRRLYTVAIGGLILVIIFFYIFTREVSHTAQTASPLTATSTPATQLASAPPAPPPIDPVPPPTAPPEVTSAAPEPETPPQTQSLRIDIDVTEAAWIKVQADGVTVNSGEILQPGMTRHFTAQNSISVATGNAGGLTLKINDMPAKSLGKRGQVREFKITPETLKNFLG
jgi:cytoskeletal protein RodZ